MPKAEDMHRLSTLSAVRRDLMRSIAWSEDNLSTLWSLYPQDKQDACPHMLPLPDGVGHKVLLAALDIVTLELAAGGVDTSTQRDADADWYLQVEGA